MGKGAFHQDEAARVATLASYDVMDTPREPAFDNIVASAALLCNAPIAAINFIDGSRQWSKAAIGVASLDMPLELSICSTTLQEKDIYIVRDIAADGRFDSLAQIAIRPMPRFYAGVPLETSEGFRIGSLCVLDYEVRDLSAEQQAGLEALARHAMAELELRQALCAERRARLEAERLLTEKETLIACNDILVREVDHRVKNSLQLVASMLNLQARRLPAGAAVQALLHARQRISGIAAVHDQLYRASGVKDVDMKIFLEGLVGSLAQNRPENVRAVDVDAEPVVVTSQRAMKIGLLVAELVTNAFKHAFPQERQGKVRVRLTSDGDSLQLVVSDDGVGMASGVEHDGLGLRVVAALLQQLDGTLDTTYGAGTSFTVRLPRSPNEAGIRSVLIPL